MKFGLFCSFQSVEQPPRFEEVYRAIFEQLAAAEELGFDSVLLSEHHFMENGYCPSLLPVAAAIGARTQRLKLITLLLLPLHHPVRVAEDAAVVDVISGGRLVLGLGLGYRDVEFRGFGIPKNERGRRMDEGIAIVRGCWTDDSFSFEGRHFQLDGINVQPKPVQRPRPPIWVGAQSKPALLRAAGTDGHIYGTAPLPFLVKQQHILHDALSERGKNAAEFETTLIRECFVGESDEQAWEEAGEYFLEMYRRDYLSWDQVVEADEGGKARYATQQDDPMFERERFSRDRAIIGSPDYCIAEIRRYREQLDFDNLILRMHMPGLPLDKVMRSMQLFAREVLPHFAEDPGVAR